MRRTSHLGVTGLFAALVTFAAASHAQDRSPIGFGPGSRKAQAKAEAKALAIPTPDSARSWLRLLTEEPHVAGTAADLKTATEVRDKLNSWGWGAELVEYEVLLNYPVPGSVKLEVVRPEALALKVSEDPYPLDKDSASPDAFPGFHGYGVSGDVTGQVVYANYGRPEDFVALDGMGVDVRGKIVLVRYGEVFRGLKIRNAQKRGARGVLIFSDPADDGYGRGDVYPHGPYRSGSSIQRGSVQFLSLGPGDPTTPGFASRKGVANRLPFDEFNGFTLNSNDSVLNEKGERVFVNRVKEWEKATGLIREDYFATIPSLPISYDSARPILDGLGGPNAPTGWQGGLPLPYHVGPGPTEVHFAVSMEYKLRTIWNVVAKIQGSVEPDRWVLVGNHRDAWVYGAVDPSSGTATTLEMCRALGEAFKDGWKPRRSIIYASWDAEEYGLVGSTEWTDEHAADIDTKAVMLLNVDSAVSGPTIDLDGVPSLREFLLEAAGGVNDVRTGRSLRDGWLAKQKSTWAGGGPLDLDEKIWNDVPTSASNLAASPRPFSPQLNPMGSGSDYTAFLDHLGVPSIDVGFTGRYGVYHSVYDDFYWMEKFGDPEFITHATAARLYTLIAIRAASAEIVPLRFTPYGDALRDYVDDLRRMLARKARAADPGAKPALAFAGLPRLVEAVKNFQAQAIAADKATTSLALIEGVPIERLSRVNDALTRVERSFLLPAGLPGRPWFKHAIYAPGLTTGYACWPMPGVRQGVIENDAALLEAQNAALVARIDAASEALKLVAKLAADEPKPPKAAEVDEAKPGARPAGPGQ
jgi:N-acetylated-alpha-linked acidic dipeptidase